MNWLSQKQQPEQTYDWAQASKEHGTLKNAVRAANEDAATYYHMHPAASQEYYCGHCGHMVPLSSFPHPHIC